jgi:hypothetical protein
MDARSILVATALMASGASLATDIPFTGPNCGLRQPPAASGEENVHGHALKIYPRVKDIPHKYAGCLLTWAPTAEGYSPIGVTKFDAGVAVAHWSPLDEKLCKYQAGEPVDSAQDCPMYRFITPKSMPSGCVEKQMTAGGTVPGCKYE